MDLVRAINQALGNEGLSQERLDQSFETWWPKLEEKLRAIPQQPMPAAVVRNERDMIEEILEGVRALTRLAQREEQIRQIEGILGSPGNRFAIIGRGGQGSAREYMFGTELPSPLTLPDASPPRAPPQEPTPPGGIAKKG